MKIRKTLINDDYLDYVFEDNSLIDRVPDWIDDLDLIFGIAEKSGEKTIQPIVYTFYDKEKHPLYVGKSVDIFQRMKWHHRAQEKGRERWLGDVAFLGLILFDDVSQMNIAEIVEISIKRPKFNRDCRDDYSGATIPMFRPEGPSFTFQPNYTEDIFPYNLWWVNQN